MGFTPMTAEEVHSLCTRLDVLILTARFVDDPSVVYGLGRKLARFRFVSQGGEWVVLRGPVRTGDRVVIPIARARKE